MFYWGSSFLRIEIWFVFIDCFQVCTRWVEWSWTTASLKRLTSVSNLWTCYLIINLVQLRTSHHHGTGRCVWTGTTKLVRIHSNGHFWNLRLQIIQLITLTQLINVCNCNIINWLIINLYCCFINLWIIQFHHWFVDILQGAIRYERLYLSPFQMVFDFVIYFVQTFCINIRFFYQNGHSANSYDVSNSHYGSLLHTLLLMFLLRGGFLWISILTQVIMIGNDHETPSAEVLELLGNIRIFSFDLCCLVKMEILTLIHIIAILGLHHTQSWYLGHTWLVQIATWLWLGPLGLASFGNIAGAF